MGPSEINIAMSRCLKLASQNKHDKCMSMFWYHTYLVFREEKANSQWSI